MNKYRAWDLEDKKMKEVTCIDFFREFVEYDNGATERLFKDVVVMQSSEFIDEEKSDDIWEFDLLEVESPKGKFVAKVEKCFGTFGIIAINGEISDYFSDHWCDSFMPLIDIYWNENGDDGCLPGTKRLGTSFEKPELLKEVE